MDAQIDYVATDEVRAALASIGRTEDVKFSPDNKRLAVAGFARNILLIIDCQLVATASSRKVLLNDFVEINSATFSDPHGLSFIDNETLVVANRAGNVLILKIPPGGSQQKMFSVEPLQTLTGNRYHPVESPGSVAVYPLDSDLFEVLVCNNYVNKVTRHLLDARQSLRVMSNETLLQKWLEIPDGIAVDRAQRWIAVSNHSKHCVMLYENTEELDHQAEPAGILRDVAYPHGLCFTTDGDFILVADAGAPFVHIYSTCGTIAWHGMHEPLTSLRVIDEEIYLAGRCSAEEGGPKGLDIDAEMSLLVTTCEKQPLAFFDLSVVLSA